MIIDIHVCALFSTLCLNICSLIPLWVGRWYQSTIRIAEFQCSPKRWLENQSGQASHFESLQVLKNDLPIVEGFPSLFWVAEQKPIQGQGKTLKLSLFEEFYTRFCGISKGMTWAPILSSFISNHATSHQQTDQYWVVEQQGHSSLQTTYNHAFLKRKSVTVQTQIQPVSTS